MPNLLSPKNQSTILSTLISATQITHKIMQSHCAISPFTACLLHGHIHPSLCHITSGGVYRDMWHFFPSCFHVFSAYFQPEVDWEVDLDHLASLIDRDTAAIVVNNPSNPCGSVYTRDHLLAILEVADYFKVPIIADEIYDDLVFPGHFFYPLASLTETVPVLACNGLTKKWAIPPFGFLVVRLV